MFTLFHVWTSEGMVLPHLYYEFYAKLRHLFKQLYNLSLGISSPWKLDPSASEKVSKIKAKVLRNPNKCLQRLPFKNIFSALTFTHNESYCYSLYFPLPLLRLHGESEDTAKKHNNITNIVALKFCFVLLFLLSFLWKLHF